MLEAIRNLGENLSKFSNEKFIYSLIKEKVNGKYLLIINFDTKQNLIQIENLKEIDESILRDYLWVGNNSGNLPQDRLTTDNIEYILGGSLYNLYKKITDSEFKETLKIITDKFHLKVNSDYFLDLSKIENSELNSEEIINNINEISKENLSKKDLKNKILKYLKELFLTILEKSFKGFKEKDIGLYTITIDNKQPKDILSYINYIESSLIDEPFMDEKFYGYCYVCGKEDLLTYDTTKFIDKYYITKLIIFSSDIDKRNFKKNLSLCRDCYKYILVGSRFLNNKLNFKLFGTNFYLIPSFIYKPAHLENIIEKFIEPLKEDFYSIVSLDNFIQLISNKEKFIKDYIKYFESKNYINLHLLFYEKDNQSFKIQKLIKDIPSKRLDELRKVLEEINKLGNEIIGIEEKNWILSFDTIFYFFPVKMDRNKAVGIRKIIDIYEKILNKQKLEKLFLIEEFNNMAKTYYFANSYTQIKIPKENKRFLDANMVRSILQTNLFIKYLRLLNLIDGGEKVIQNLDEYPLSEDLKNYIKSLEFSEKEAALFLLGYLIGEIGKKQRNPETNKKPILDKINYNGMSLTKIINLTNDVFDKLNQYRIRQYNEGIFYSMKNLFDKNLKSWDLKDSENVYYILSGYAFSTYKSFKKEVKDE